MSYYHSYQKRPKSGQSYPTRGNKNKRVVRYSSIPDTVDHKLESRRAAPTWRRMAICILKNDYLCKGLSFAQTKDQSERMKMLIEKYKNI
jgi:predicted phosphoadenosine phosphosulfate sulfurtransferase